MIGIFALMIGLSTQMENITPFILAVLSWGERIARMPGGPVLISFLYMVATLLFLPGGLIQIGIGFTLMRAYDSKTMALGIGGPVVLIGS